MSNTSHADSNSNKIQHPHQKIAIIGMSGHYPGAKDLCAYWENILARKRQFRRIPEQRFPLADYFDPDPAVPDKTYCYQGGFIDGFEFDRIKYRVPASTFASTDIVHWLALEQAIMALADAGYQKGNIATEKTGVIVGNSLTGEQIRSESMRLRWPYVRKVLMRVAQEKGLSTVQAQDFVDTTESYYKSVFAPITEDSLAGALSNTIAGRICNYFDFHGGGFTIDGACSSSVLAIAKSADALSNGDTDLMLAGGVDISLDTLELIGFAKTGAITQSDMRVYDQRGDGFLPGEGCGFIVMKRLSDAERDGDMIYAVLNGWGISSDGKGGLTAPNAQGQARAIQRAYQKANYGVADLDFIEGHGTGTAAGDKAELTSIKLAIQASQRPIQSVKCGMTSLKTIIGHTKAASGIGGFIKAVIAANRRVLPPLANCDQAHAFFKEKDQVLYPITRGEIREANDTLHVGISGMGFGGINCHLTISSAGKPSEKFAPSVSEDKLLVSNQDSELFVFAAASVEKLRRVVQEFAHLSDGMCEGELVDLANLSAQQLEPASVYRLALLASTPQQLAARLTQAQHSLSEMIGDSPVINDQEGIYISLDSTLANVGFLFPGQGSQMLNMGRKLIERHDWAAELVGALMAELEPDLAARLQSAMFRDTEKEFDTIQLAAWQNVLKQTEITQPAICLACILWLEKLKRLGIKPDVVGGHSLGELVAAAYASGLDYAQLIRLAAIRGQMMAAQQIPGSMASLRGTAEQIQPLLDSVNGYVVIANHNSPLQTIISGETAAVVAACELAQQQDIHAQVLEVSNAFHSKLVADAAQQFSTNPLNLSPRSLTQASLFSCMDGQLVSGELDLVAHLSQQITAPVQFVEMVNNMSACCQLIFEVGPKRVLSNLVGAIQSDVSCYPVESRAGCDQDLNRMLALSFINGGDIHWDALYADRLVRPFVPAADRLFIVNPCEKPITGEPGKTILSGGGDESFTQQLQAIAGLNNANWSDYLNRRKDFLTGMIKLDAATLPVLTGQSGVNQTVVPITSKNQVASDTVRVNTDVNLESVEQMVFYSIAEKTGFPTDSLDSNLRLLDDLNLDSIKASELLLDVGHKLNIAANQFDVNQLSNATLGDIVTRLEQLVPVENDTGVKESVNIATVLLQNIEQKTGFPIESLSTDLRLLDDLNLDSIKASELMVATVQQLNLANAGLDLAQYANAPLFEIIAVLEEALANQLAMSTPLLSDSDSDTWVRDFAVHYIEAPLTATPDKLASVAHILVISDEDLLEVSLPGISQLQHCSFDDLSSDISLTSVDELIVCLPKTHETIMSASAISASVQRLQKIVTLPFSKHHVSGVTVVQFGGGYLGENNACGIQSTSAKALFASLHLECPELKVRVLDFDVEVSVADLSTCIVAELHSGEPEHFISAAYDAALVRRVPRAALTSRAQYSARSLNWSAQDVVLVTGGAKGITKECALTFARQVGVKLALVGRSPLPAADDQQNEIAQSLAEYSAAGVSAQYFQCDVTQQSDINTLLSQVESKLGVITGLIHGSALNIPRELAGVSAAEALQEISPKLLGLIYLLHGLRQPLKLIAGFSSIIGVSGMMRNGWYGYANEAMNLLLQQYQRQYTDTQIISMAFSIWDEVGMGVRMGSTQFLARMGIDAIPVKQGVEHFMRLMMADPGHKQIVIAARTAGLDTFVPELSSVEYNFRFIERVVKHYPGVELVARAGLSLDKDDYVRDHVWKGTYLFPTVFGLEAMAQAVKFLTNVDDFSQLVIENIDLSRPITVPEHGESEIEIRALVLEPQKDELCITVEIRTADSGFGVAHFKADFVLNSTQSLPAFELDLPEQPLAISAQVDLYNGQLLFQGPMYQRIQNIYHLSEIDTIFSVNVLDADVAPGGMDYLILGDPFIRDALLQSGQLPIPQEIALPRQIRRLERFSNEVKPGERLFGKVEIKQHTETDISGDVLLFNQSGQLIEYLQGYQVKVMSRHPDRASALAMIAPDQRDAELIQAALDPLAQRLAIQLPEILTAYIPGLSEQDKAARRVIEKPYLVTVAKQCMNIEEHQVCWDESGKPILQDSEKYEVSLSHNQHHLLVTAQCWPQGCDLEQIRERSEADWEGLLGVHSTRLFTQLRDEFDDVNQEGTRLWCLWEAIYKSLGVRDAQVEICAQYHEAVLFMVTTESASLNILTLPIMLTLGGSRMLAITVANVVQERSLPIVHNTQGDVSYLQYIFQTSFMDSRGGSGKVFFTNIPVWMGKLRELVLEPISAQLIEDMTSGKWGMVTNTSSMHFLKLFDSLDRVAGRLRLSEESNIEESFISINFSWGKLNGEEFEPVATSNISVTWVEVLGHGLVKKAPIPDYLKQHITGLLAYGIEPKLSNKSKWQSLPKYEADLSSRKHLLLQQVDFQTSLEDSNLVGNIYYSHYYSWQARVRDQFLYLQMPSLFQFDVKLGEFICVDAKVNHLQEAMPFESIEISMYLDRLSQDSLGLYFEYYSVGHAHRRKLAYGNQTVVWHSNTAAKEAGNRNAITPAPMPAPIFDVLEQKFNQAMSRKK